MGDKNKWSHSDYDLAYQKRSKGFYKAEQGEFHISKRFRMHALRKYLLGHVPKNERVLDVGCGSAMYFHELLADTLSPSNIVGIDFSRAALNLAKTNISKEDQFITLSQADARVLPFDDNTFQVILAFEVLEHIWEDDQVVKEFYRVLKPGGYLVASMPSSKHFPLGPIWLEFLIEGKIALDEKVGHVRRYDKNMLLNLFRMSGFNVKNILPYFHFVAAYIKFLNDNILLKSNVRHNWLYQKLFFPLALGFCQLETALFSGIYYSYGILALVRKDE